MLQDICRLAGASDYGGINGFHRALGCWYAINGGQDDARHHICGVLACPANSCETGNVAGIAIEQVTDGTSTTLLSEEMAGKPDLWIKGVKTAMSASAPSPVQCAYRTGHGFTINNPGGCWGCWNNSLHWVIGSTFNGKGFPTGGAPTCFFNCTNENNANCVYRFHPGKRRRGDVRWLGSHGEREHRRDRLSQYAQLPREPASFGHPILGRETAGKPNSCPPMPRGLRGAAWLCTQGRPYQRVLRLESGRRSDMARCRRRTPGRDAAQTVRLGTYP